MDFIKSVGGAINSGLKQSKIISTLAPNLPIPFASQIGKVAGNLGYAKGGRILKKGMKKGGKVGRPRKEKAPAAPKKPRGRPRKVKAM